MLFARDYRAIARNALRGNWGTAIGVTLVAGLLGAESGLSVPSNNMQYRFNNADVNEFTAQMPVLERFTWMRQQLEPYAPLITVAFVLCVLWLVFGGAARLGLCQYNTLLLRGEQPAFGALFKHMNRKARAFGLRFMMWLFTVLWTFLFVIPGIVAGFRYAMAPYIMAQDLNIGIMDAIARSKEMMRGKKFNLFCMEFSFIGWALLCSLPMYVGMVCMVIYGQFAWLVLGGLLAIIGMFFLTPYIEAATAAFYLNASGQVDQIPGEIMSGKAGD